MSIGRYSGAEAAAACARVLAAKAAAAVHQRGYAVVGVPGGRSIAAVFSSLVGAPVAWERVELFPADERCVPIDSEESNARLIRETILNPFRSAGREAPRLHAYHDDPEDRAGSLSAFNEGFRAAAPRGRFDVLLLGVGEDGHVASLFPGHPALGAVSGEFLHVADSPKPPSARITLPPALIREARCVVLLLFGEGKRDALHALLDPARPVAECPAKLALEAPESRLFTDIE